MLILELIKKYFYFQIKKIKKDLFNNGVVGDQPHNYYKIEN